MNKNIEISILVPSKGGLLRKETFARLMESLTNTCSITEAKQVEILLRVDTVKAVDDYQPILKKTPFHFSIITGVSKGYALHKYFNTLCRQALGNFYWIMVDDCVVIGEWFYPIKMSRNLYKDNIYVFSLSCC